MSTFLRRSKLKAHKATQTHLINILKFNRYNTNKITDQIPNAYKEIVQKSNYVKMLINIVLYFKQQGITI